MSFFRIWSTTEYNTYLATFGFNYLLVATHLILSVVLWFGRSHMVTTKATRSESYRGEWWCMQPMFRGLSSEARARLHD